MVTDGIEPNCCCTSIMRLFDRDKQIMVDVLGDLE